jgi:hypothetical protein
MDNACDDEIWAGVMRFSGRVVVLQLMSVG